MMTPIDYFFRAVGLQPIDPSPQSCVSICVFNHFQYLLGWSGCFSAGKVWASLNPCDGRDELNRIIDATAPLMIVLDANCAEKFANTTAHLISARGEHQCANTHIY